MASLLEKNGHEIGKMDLSKIGSMAGGTFVGCTFDASGNVVDAEGIVSGNLVDIALNSQSEARRAGEDERGNVLVSDAIRQLEEHARRPSVSSIEKFGLPKESPKRGSGGNLLSRESSQGNPTRRSSAAALAAFVPSRPGQGYP